jgi:hypothetical protein
MTLVRLEIIGLKATQRALLRIVPDAEKALLSDLGETSELIAEQMQEPAPEPTYPINWDSPKQRAAFFATNGFGGGIPHVRTGRYVGGWKSSPIKNGFKTYNLKKYAGYIAGDHFGKRQSRIHENRWNLFLAAADKFINLLPKKVLSGVREALARLGLKSR